MSKTHGQCKILQYVDICENLHCAVENTLSYQDSPIHILQALPEYWRNHDKDRQMARHTNLYKAIIHLQCSVRKYLCRCWTQDHNQNMDLSKAQPQINTTHSVITIEFIWTSLSSISVLIVLILGDVISYKISFELRLVALFL